MKQFLKKILPPPVIQKAMLLHNQIKLGATPNQNFDTKSLRTGIDSNVLQDLFSNLESADAWNNALERITSAYGKDHNIGGVNPGDRRALYYLIHAFKPENLLEVGTHIGASTVFISEALKGVSPTARMTTVDVLDVNSPTGPWNQHGLAMPPREYLQKLGSDKRVTFRAMPSSAFLKDTAEKYDFIFLDGDHSACTVYEEVSLALKALNKDGIILLHDYYPNAQPLFNDGNIIAGPFMALDRIMKEHKNITVVPLGKLPWETKHGLNITSLALITLHASTA